MTWVNISTTTTTNGTPSSHKIMGIVASTFIPSNNGSRRPKFQWERTPNLPNVSHVHSRLTKAAPLAAPSEREKASRRWIT